jgi:membrane-bound lytic murein transglycosylase B
MLRGYSVFLLLSVVLYGPDVQAQILDREEVQSFIQKMVSKHDFDARHLHDVFSDVRESDSVLQAITRPAEALPWYQYRTIFLRDDRIRHGVRFLKKHRQVLERAEQEYGVPAEVITAIIGVETRYGKQKGGYRVLDSLSTLAFDYPPRSDFFLGELEQFLLLTREQGLDPRKVMGSYAGAMGIPQFVASSYRRYAVEFDSDGKIDIWGSSADAIGSVANYFKAHGWLQGGLVAVPALVSGDDYRELLSNGLKPDIDVTRLPVYGIFPQQALGVTDAVKLLEFQLQGGEEYWLGLENFYVITRYNHSAQYAMAAYQLAEAIKHRYQDHLAEY